MGCSVTSYNVDIDAYTEYPYEQREFQSFVESRNYFDQTCDSLQHSGGYRVLIAWINAEHLQNAPNQPISELEEIVMDFLKCIIDRYMPLGIPQDQQIQMASNKLSDGFRTISGETNYDIIYLSNSYYQMIPHSSGRSRKQWGNPFQRCDNRKNCRPPLNTIDLLNGKFEYNRRLSWLVQAIQQGIQAENVNPLDYIYNNYLNINLRPIINGSNEYRQFIWQFGFAPISYSIKRVFEVEKTEWTENFRNDIGNHQYLFHSTHLANVVSILKDGLQIAPPHVFSYNRWAGKGIYFHGNVAATSTYAQRLNHDAILVCRVALGNVQNIGRCLFNKNPNFVYPLAWNMHSLIQLGTGRSFYEQFDEFLVQNVHQVKIEFIVELN